MSTLRGGHAVPTTALADRFRRCLDRAFRLANHHRPVSSGAFDIELMMDSWALDQHFDAALLPARASREIPDLRVAIVGGADPSLFTMVPDPPDGHHLFAEGELFAHWQPRPYPVLYIYHLGEKRGLMWLPDMVVAQWLLSRPFMPILHAHASRTSWCLVHAASVGLNGKFLLFAGPGKAGKSTAALACANAGWDYAGDDFVLIDPNNGSVAPLFSSARLRTSGKMHFAGLAERSVFARSFEDEDPRLELRLASPESGIRMGAGSVVSFLLPRRVGGPQFVFSPAKPLDVFSAIFPVTAVQTPGFSEIQSRKLLAAAKMASACSVDTGSDPFAIPDAMERFMESI